MNLNGKCELSLFMEEQYKLGHTFSTDRGVVFILNGPSKSGKNMLTDWANEKLKAVYPFSFAAPLKRICAHIIWGAEHVGFDQLALLEQNKDKEGYGCLEAVTPRDILIALSEDVIKPLCGQEYFGRVAMMRLVYLIEKHGAECFIASDGGFAVELDPIIRFFGSGNVFVINLCREGCTYESDSRGYLTPEQFSSPPSFLTLHNNGTPEEVRESFSDLITKVMTDYYRCMFPGRVWSQD
jgi:hypothetical protein